jgi:hypothetical protein
MYSEIDIESILRNAFGNKPIPEPSQVPSESLTTYSEARALTEIYGGKEYDQINPAWLPSPEGLTGYLTPVAFAYYIGGVASLALHDPEGNPAFVLANSFTSAFENRPGQIAPEFDELDKERLHALKEVFEFLCAQALSRDDEELADQSSEAIKNIVTLMKRLEGA